MKILMTLHSFGINTFEGMQNSFYNLCLGFIENDVEVIIYTNKQSLNKPANVKIYNSEELHLSTSQEVNSLYTSIYDNRQRINNEIKNIVFTEEIDFIVSFDPILGITQPSQLWINPPCPIVLSLHNVPRFETLKQSLKANFLFRRAVSNFLKDELNRFVNAKDVVVIPNSINLNLFHPLANPNKNSKIIFCNSRIAERKGIEDLIIGFAKFSKEHNEFELWLCDGEYPSFQTQNETRAKILSLINKHDISKRVNLLSNLKWQEIPGLIQNSFVVVFPTLYETFGRAAIETLACGIPLITTNVGNLPNLVQDAAIIIEPGSPKSIYNALLDLLMPYIVFLKIIHIAFVVLKLVVIGLVARLSDSNMLLLTIGVS